VVSCRARVSPPRAGLSSSLCSGASDRRRREVDEDGVGVAVVEA